MSKPTIYERRQAVAKEVAISKAEKRGTSDWGFGYRGQTVVVTATKQSDGKITTRTTKVKNK